MASSASAGFPAFVNEAPSEENLEFWQEDELVNLSYHLIKPQVLQDQDTEQLVEGSMLSQYTTQSVLASWAQDEEWSNTVLSR